MSSVSDILRPYALSGLYNVSGTTNQTFKDWIENEPLVLDRYEGEGVASEFYFYVSDRDKLLRSLAFDVSRMSIAAFESICSISSDREIPRSTAWPLIRSYYAAFFSAHTLMRIFGYGVVQLDGGQSTKLNNAMRYHVKPPKEKISDGLNLIEIKTNEPIFKLKKLQRSSHEDTWSVFATVMKHISVEILKDKNPVSAQKKQELSTQIDLLLMILSTHPCGSRSNWLSKMRNEINYQHKHGAWYPHEKSKNFRERVYANLSVWNKPPIINITDKTHHLDKYTQACTYLISMTKILIEDMIERNPDNNSFLKINTLKALKQAETVQAT